jgi:hypothetical protein
VGQKGALGFKGAGGAAACWWRCCLLVALLPAMMVLVALLPARMVLVALLPARMVLMALLPAMMVLVALLPAMMVLVALLPARMALVVLAPARTVLVALLPARKGLGASDRMVTRSLGIDASLHTLSEVMVTSVRLALAARLPRPVLRDIEARALRCRLFRALALATVALGVVSSSWLMVLGVLTTTACKAATEKMAGKAGAEG